MKDEEHIKALLGVTEVMEIELAPGSFQKVWKCTNLPEGMIYIIDAERWDNLKGTLYGELQEQLGRSPLTGTWKVE